MTSAAEKLDQEITHDVLAAMPDFHGAFWDAMSENGAPVSSRQQMVEIWDAIVKDDKERLFDLIKYQVLMHLIRVEMSTLRYEHLSEDDVFDNL